MTKFTEEWDKLAEETMAREYEKAGVKPGDHLGYFLRRTEPGTALLKSMRSGRTIPNENDIEGIRLRNGKADCYCLSDGSCNFRCAHVKADIDTLLEEVRRLRVLALPSLSPQSPGGVSWSGVVLECGHCVVDARVLLFVGEDGLAHCARVPERP